MVLRAIESPTLPWRVTAHAKRGAATKGPAAWGAKGSNRDHDEIIRDRSEIMIKHEKQRDQHENNIKRSGIDLIAEEVI